MPSIRLTNVLKEEYQNLFDSCIINFSAQSTVENISNRLISNKDRYETVGENLGIPWFFIGVIHNMESSMNFNTHLHNGDPLTKRTTHVPSGRPKSGEPPFTWEESAEDALKFKNLDNWKDWTVPGILYKLEQYNGWGYRKYHPHVLSPYLWSYSNHYTSGKYVADGRWSETAVSRQCGAAVILRRLAEKNEIAFEGEPVVEVTEEIKPLLRFSNRKLLYADDLQNFLNKFPGIYLKVDGYPGKKTSTAFKKVTGYYLKGDERG